MRREDFPGEDWELVFHFQSGEERNSPSPSHMFILTPNPPTTARELLFTHMYPTSLPGICRNGDHCMRKQAPSL